MEAALEKASPLRVLVVDDTSAYRTIVSSVLSELPGVEVVGTAGNGMVALSKIKTVRPDLLTLDIEMPEMNGIEVLDAVKRESLDVGVIVVSGLTVRGGELTMKALERGAFDFITKPDGGSAQENAMAMKTSLGKLIKAYGDRQEVRALLKKAKQPLAAAAAQKNRPDEKSLQLSQVPLASTRLRSEIVGIGISTGGPNALMKMLPLLPADVNVPVMIVQHMPPLFTQSLAASLRTRCALQVKEGENEEPLLPNIAYIAPGGRQMKVAVSPEGKTRIIRVTDDPPENNCRPSVDYLFRSLAHVFPGRSTGVIMTGMGSDGLTGLRLMRRSGSQVIAQDQASCIVFGMPKEAIDAGVVDVIAPLDHIADEIVRTIR